MEWCALARRSLAATLALLLAGEGLYYLLRHLRRTRQQQRRPKVLFFPAPVTCVRPLLWANDCRCSLPHRESALSSLTRLLLGARRSLDVCVFTISSLELSASLLQVHGRGVRVRVVTDSDFMALAGSQVGALREAGLPWRLRTKSSASLGVVKNLLPPSDGSSLNVAG